MVLFDKIKTTVVRDGLQWGENCELKPVAHGIKKICMTAVISMDVSMDEIIEEIVEVSLKDEVQSMEMTSMTLL
jgi:translation elongation factor EF-1beta